MPPRPLSVRLNGIPEAARGVTARHTLPLYHFCYSVRPVHHGPKAPPAQVVVLECVAIAWPMGIAPGMRKDQNLLAALATVRGFHGCPSPVATGRNALS